MVTRVPVTTSEQLTLLVVPPIFLLVATVALVLRFWSRKKKAQRRGADDYLCLAALIVTYAEFGAVVGAVVWGGHGETMDSFAYGNFVVLCHVGRVNTF